MRNVFPYLAALVALTGCYDPALRAMKKYETEFTCSAEDFKQMQSMVHKYFSGPKTLRFLDSSEGAFLVANRLNLLIAEKCPRSVLVRCAYRNERAELVTDADEIHASRMVRGPLEEFGILSIEDQNFETFSRPKPVWVTTLEKPAKFRAALQCFSAR